MPKPVTETEVINFLQQSKLNIQIASIDEEGYPVIQPVPLDKMLMKNTRNGTEVVIEITPKFFSAWDFSKAMYN
jgi:hypothetical protein